MSRWSARTSACLSTRLSSGTSPIDWLLRREQRRQRSDGAPPLRGSIVRALPLPVQCSDSRGEVQSSRSRELAPLSERLRLQREVHHLFHGLHVMQLDVADLFGLEVFADVAFVFAPGHS